MAQLHKIQKSADGTLIDQPMRVYIVYAEKPRTYINEKKRSMQVIEGVVVDGTGHKRFSCYNKSAFPFMKTGNSVMLLHFLSKIKEVVIRTGTRVILIPTILSSLPSEVVLAAEKEATELNSPPLARTVTVEEALEIPQGSLFHIICKVTKVDDIQKVNTSYGSEVEVRNGEMGDDTGSLCFAFWRHLASFPLEVGQCLKVNNGIMSSTSYGLPKVTSRQKTTLEIVPPDTIKTVKPFGSETLQEIGQIEGMSSVHIFPACEKSGCFRRGLKEKTCPKCSTVYSDLENTSKSAVCEVLVTKPDKNTEELTLFHSQIEELLRGTNKQIQPDEDKFLSDVMEILPVKVTYTPSPKKDKTLSSFKKVDP